MKIGVNLWQKYLSKNWCLFVTKTKNNAFTIIELLVAMTLLVILVGLSSAVFSLTVKSQRSATASIEITRSLRVLTDQLNADFRGLRKDAPVMVWFDAVGNDDDGSTIIEPDEYVYYDMVHFFADGDFQTMKQYNDGTGNKTVFGNIARIFYGHANSVDLIADTSALADFEAYRTLARKTHILTADSGILSVYGQIPLITDSSGNLDYTEFVGSFGVSPVSLAALVDSDENRLELSTISLTEWINALNYLDAGNPDNADAFIAQCMDDDRRPFIDLIDGATLHLLMAQGVTSFTVQWAYTNDDLVTAAGVPAPSLFAGVRWWPSVDPDGDGVTTDSDFAGMNSGNPFGVFFTLPNGTTNADWFAIGNCQTTISGTSYFFSPAFYPEALKFTFTLHDSNGMYEDGKTFTHIVYLDD